MKKKSSVRELQGLLRSYSFLNTLKTSLKIFYQEKLLQEKLVINFCILPFRRFNSKTSKMSICVWKYLRKTITSTTENNFHQVHRRLEEKLFKLQFVDKKELRCFKTSGAWTFDPSTFFLSNTGLRKFSENRHFEKKPSLSSHHRRQPLKSTVRKFVQHFDTYKNFPSSCIELCVLLPRRLQQLNLKTHFIVMISSKSPEEVRRKIASEKNLKTTKKNSKTSFGRHLDVFIIFFLPTLRRISN